MNKIPAGQRPDGGITLTQQLSDVFDLGSCEVKPADAEKRAFDTHTDVFRLAMFCKNAVDRGEILCMLGIQAVGKMR